MPGGKPAGVPCIHLDDEMRCRLYGDPRRPAVCARLAPNPEMCGDTREHALVFLRDLERLTQPAAPHDGAVFSS
ncbi:hypothetical protein SAMN04488120_107111 [Fontimonas thermophila]|uniref:Proteinase inhibitor n=2 Tax=Fontimonas thermophila TaxID=1076937 RepID=A0A1I2JKP7_9GAMM|nr:hypothetical protein SAMN04488120_107111 [Fontimonas thermophila]